MDVEIGSNLFRDTDGTIEVEGVPQIEVTLRTPSGPLLVNFVLFDDTGRLIAKVVNSSLAFNEMGVYEVSRSPTSFVMTQVESKKVTLKADLKEVGRVVISQGEFVTAKGHLLEISPVECKVGKNRSSWGDTDAKGGPAAIG